MISASLDSLAFLLALEAVMSQKRKTHSKGGRKPSAKKRRFILSRVATLKETPMTTNILSILHIP